MKKKKVFEKQTVFQCCFEHNVYVGKYQMMTVQIILRSLDFILEKLGINQKTSNRD